MPSSAFFFPGDSPTAAPAQGQTTALAHAVGCPSRHGILHPVRDALLPLVLFVVPRETGSDLLQVHVLAAEQYLAEILLIPITFLIFDDHELAGDRFGQVTLWLCAVCLSAFGRIDARQLDLMLRITAIEHDDGVAVDDANHAAGEGVCKDNGLGKSQE